MRDITEAPVAQYYLPMSNLPKSLGDGSWSSGRVLLVRATPAAVGRVLPALTQALRTTFPTGYADVSRLSDVFAPRYRPWRVGATLFTGLSVLALIVALVGIYSTVSYSVTQRTHEFGVRIALGARLGDVLRLVLGEGLRAVLVGVVLGVALALAGGRLIASLLYGVTPSNPGVMTFVSIVLFVTAVAATLIPAWRAGRVDPMIALRAE
jgi:ABC-type antimicrobial peptide transport system permease subunit